MGQFRGLPRKLFAPRKPLLPFIRSNLTHPAHRQRTGMIEYVVGFLFDRSLEHVALIRKQKPEWQKGLLNGIGGKIEPGELVYSAMVREFQEETNAHIATWTRFCTLVPNDNIDALDYCRVYFFYAVEDAALASPTDEKVGWFYCSLPPSLRVVPNLHWLIPMALKRIRQPEFRETGTLVFC